MLQPQIVEKPDLKVVGLEAAFIHALSPEATNFEVIGPLWQRFLAVAKDIPHRAGGDMFGVMYARPQNERSHPDELQYIAAVPVSKTTDVPSGMVSRVIPAGRFAVFTHRGPIHQIGECVREIYREWLPNSAWRHSGIADVELYDERFGCGGEDSEMEYWISVAPKATPV